MIIAVCIVYIKDRTFGVGGGGLTAGGVLLVGLSVWSQASISISGTGVEARFESIEQKVNAVEQKNASVSQRLEVVGENVKQVNEKSQAATEELAKVAQTQSSNTERVAQLTEALAAAKPIKPEVFQRLREDLKSTPKVDVSRLQRLSRVPLKE
ncbi:MAG TPA: hypothetical protein VFN67_09745 [Polyangiales bacterium]|nr:hypothetical protein [Polyangiales bacterium]